MELPVIIQQLGKPGVDSEKEELLQELHAKLSYLIQHDFDALVQLLYTLDIDEKKLKAALENNTQVDTAHLLSGLILERQLQKAATRQAFKPGTASDEERW